MSRRHATGRILALFVSAVVLAAAVRAESSDHAVERDITQLAWQIDARPVLRRGEGVAIDRGVVGDPCIVWDDARATWRMFYFASGIDPATGAKGPRTAMALATSAEAIGPGDWRKIGLVRFTNPEALINANDYHKWWIVMDARQPNHAARIGGKLWALFVASKPLADGRLHKHIQAASATSVDGPWTVQRDAILAPGAADALDGLHADTPSAFWFNDRRCVAIFYKGYPAEPQREQPTAPFGSDTLLAVWHPGDASAQKLRIILRAGGAGTWNKGWTSSIQLLPPIGNGPWRGLHNGSPTAPADRSHREPAPSLGGWVFCDGDPIDGNWRVDDEHSPFRRPEQLTPPERAAGLAENFWRHHLLVTPKGQARIFFNSGAYGHEQMYSMVPVSDGG